MPVDGFGLLASAGYGASTTGVGDLEMAPYGESLGVDGGFTFPAGLRLGVYVGYGFGKAVSQRHESRVGDDRNITADSSSLNAGASIGHDVPLKFLVLRYTLNVGATWMTFEFDGTSPEAVGFADTRSPAVGLHFAPGATLLLPRGRFECGVGFDYLVQVNGNIPNGFLGKLLLGVKL